MKGFALRPLYRVLLILPWAMPNYITALIFKGMFHQQFGVVNQIIQLFGGTAGRLVRPPVHLVPGGADHQRLAVLPLHDGGLAGRPAVDPRRPLRGGAGGRRLALAAVPSITLPSLKPALVPAIILSVIWTFNSSTSSILVSAGEPGGSTEILVTQAYKLAFEQYRYGYAAAYSAIIFLILFVYGILQNRVSRRHGGRSDERTRAARAAPTGRSTCSLIVFMLLVTVYPILWVVTHRLLRRAEPGHRHAAGEPHAARPAARHHPRGRSTFSVANFRSRDRRTSRSRRWMLNSAIMAAAHHGARRLPGLHRGLRLLAASASPAGAAG